MVKVVSGATAATTKSLKAKGCLALSGCDRKQRITGETLLGLNATGVNVGDVFFGSATMATTFSADEVHMTFFRLAHQRLAAVLTKTVGHQHPLCQALWHEAN